MNDIAYNSYISDRVDSEHINGINTFYPVSDDTYSEVDSYINKQDKGFDITPQTVMDKSSNSQKNHVYELHDDLLLFNEKPVDDDIPFHEIDAIDDNSSSNLNLDEDNEIDEDINIDEDMNIDYDHVLDQYIDEYNNDEDVRDDNIEYSWNDDNIQESDQNNTRNHEHDVIVDYGDIYSQDITSSETLDHGLNEDNPLLPILRDSNDINNVSSEDTTPSSTRNRLESITKALGMFKDGKISYDEIQHNLSDIENELMIIREAMKLPVKQVDREINTVDNVTNKDIDDQVIETGRYSDDIQRHDRQSVHDNIASDSDVVEDDVLDTSSNSNQDNQSSNIKKDIEEEVDRYHDSIVIVSDSPETVLPEVNVTPVIESSITPSTPPLSTGIINPYP